MEFEAAGEYGFRVSLDDLAKQYGFDGKNGNGKLFYTYSRAEQEAYLENDLLITRKIFEVQNNSFNICDNLPSWTLKRPQITMPRSWHCSRV